MTLLFVIIKCKGWLKRPSKAWTWPLRRRRGGGVRINRSLCLIALLFLSFVFAFIPVSRSSLLTFQESEITARHAADPQVSNSPTQP